MERYHPGFAESYPKFREEAIQSINPEWIASEPAKRLGSDQGRVKGLNGSLGRMA
jgi:hypothetical protein